MNDSQRLNFRLFRLRFKGLDANERKILVRAIKLVAAGPVGWGILMGEALAQAVVAHERRNQGRSLAGLAVPEIEATAGGDAVAHKELKPRPIRHTGERAPSFPVVTYERRTQPAQR